MSEPESELTVFHCPKCGNACALEAVVEAPGSPDLRVFQCGACLVPWEFDGVTFQIAYTFGVDTAGRVVEVPSGAAG